MSFPPHQKASYQRAEPWRRITPIRRPGTGARESLCLLSRHMPHPCCCRTGSCVCGEHLGVCVCGYVCGKGVAALDTLARLVLGWRDTRSTALLRGLGRSSHMTGVPAGSLLSAAWQRSNSGRQSQRDHCLVQAAQNNCGAAPKMPTFAESSTRAGALSGTGLPTSTAGIAHGWPCQRPVVETRASSLTPVISRLAMSIQLAAYRRSFIPETSG